jgi:hypothetical protein
VPSQGPAITFFGTPGHYRIERVYLWQEIVGLLISALSLAIVIGLGVQQYGQAWRRSLRSTSVATN